MNDKKENRWEENPRFWKFVDSVFRDWTYTKHYDIFLEVEASKNGYLLDPLVDEFVEWLESDAAIQYLKSEEAINYYRALLSEKEATDESV